MEAKSTAETIALLPERERKEVISNLSQKEAEETQYDWRFWARPNQLPPDWNWYVWLMLSGRGGGKTRAENELIIQWAREGHSPIALIGETKADVRDVIIEQGPASILKISAPWFMPMYEPSKRRLTWPNGVVGIAYSGDEPNQLRGPQHAKALVDELAKYKYPEDTWNNLMFGLRVGTNPQAVVATTPRPIKIIKNLVKDKTTAVTRSHTLENKANLAPSFLHYILPRYEGTRLGRQELAGEILEDNPEALWNRDKIDELKVTKHPDLSRIVVAIDPQGTNTEESAETGIVVAGIAQVGDKVHGYVLADLTIKGTPDQWASSAVAGYHVHKADRIVGESNFGGDMVEHTVRTVDKSVSYKAVHASHGKYVRAEPVSALYEQGRIHHVGAFPLLEDELTEWVPGAKSPNRLDALVWAITELMLKEEKLVRF